MAKPANRKIISIYKKKLGNVSSTCEALGISRQTFYNYKDKYDDLRQGLEEADESMLDWAETKLLESINDGNLSALIFYLKTKGKKRGYIEQLDQNITTNSFEKLMMELPDED